MVEIEIEIENKIYQVIFLRLSKLVYRYRGRETTIVTQCIIREKDGLYIGVGTAIKDSRDEDDKIIGKRVALKSALKLIIHQSIRKEFWNKLKLGHNE